MNYWLVVFVGGGLPSGCRLSPLHTMTLVPPVCSLLAVCVGRFNAFAPIRRCLPWGGLAWVGERFPSPLPTRIAPATQLSHLCGAVEPPQHSTSDSLLLPLIHRTYSWSLFVQTVSRGVHAVVLGRLLAAPPDVLAFLEEVDEGWWYGNLWGCARTIRRLLSRDGLPAESTASCQT